MQKLYEEVVSNCCGAGYEYERCSACKEGCGMEVLHAEYRIGKATVRVDFDMEKPIDITIYEGNEIVLSADIDTAMLVKKVLDEIEKNLNI